MTFDQSIVQFLIMAEKNAAKSGVPHEFEERALELIPQIQNDNAYWQLLAAAWIKSGTQRRREDWRQLFSTPRRNRHKIMKKGDRRRWRKLPSTLVAYRAINEEDEAQSAFSWTTSREVAGRLSHGRPVVSRRFRKKEIVALFTRRGEDEIIVLTQGNDQ